MEQMSCRKMLLFVGGRVGANPGYKEIDEWLHKKNFPIEDKT